MQERFEMFYEGLKDYDRLEKASKTLHLEETQETEEMLINLHNHIIWHSYIPGLDDVTDAIFCNFVFGVMKDCGLPPEYMPNEYRRLVRICRKEM